MKKLFFLLFFVPLLCPASDTLELIGAGITYHVIDGGASNLYSNQLSHDGRLIYTPEIGLKKTHIDQNSSYDSLAVFWAKNSIGSPVWGFLGGTGVAFFRGMFNLGFAFGLYVQNNNDFRAQGITPFSMAGNTNALVPLLGLDLNMHFDITDKIFIGWNNLLTPIIINSNLSLGCHY